MKLSEIVKGIEEIKLVNPLDVEVSSIAYDSHKVTKDGMFIAIAGFKEDGHQYVMEAIQNGARVVVVEEGHIDVSQIPSDVVVVTATDTRLVMPQMACNFYEHPSRELKVVGVTGTKGKTTTSYMIKSILEHAGKKVGLIGTIAYFDGENWIDSERTSPESVDIQRLLRAMVNHGVNVAVLEVSAHSLSLHRVDGISFDIGIFTNLSQDHMDFYQSFEEYFNAKAKLFAMCKEGFVNSDDMYARKIMNIASCPMTTYGVDNNPYVSARDIIITNSYADFKMPFNKIIERIKVPIPGRFTVYNSLAAICAAIKLGAGVEDVLEGLATVKVPGRSEVVPCTRNYTILIDYAHTPDSLENILRATKSYTKGKVICVFGCGGDRDKIKRPMMGEIAGKIAGYTIITSDNPRSENPEEICKEIEEGIKNTKGKYRVIVDRRKAIEHAIRKAEKGDLILIAGKGHETYQEINGEKIPFDDRVVVQESLLKIPPAKEKKIYTW